MHTIRGFFKSLLDLNPSSPEEIQLTTTSENLRSASLGGHAARFAELAAALGEAEETRIERIDRTTERTASLLYQSLTHIQSPLMPPQAAVRPRAHTAPNSPR